MQNYINNCLNFKEFKKKIKIKIVLVSKYY